MPRFVVLLRGVNVGKSNRVPMAEFRRMLEAQGYSDVRTLLNSGNAVFSSAARSSERLAEAIALALREHLGLSVPVVVKSSEEFAAIIGGTPMVPATNEQSRFLVAFSQDSATLTSLAAISPRVQPAEHFSIGRNAAYLHCPQGLMKSKAAEAMLGRTGRAVTTRNWATVLKLRELLDAGAGRD